MKTLNTALLAAGLLAATLSTTALAAGQVNPSEPRATQSSGDATREKTQAEFLRARKAGELDYAHEFQIAETAVFKRSKPQQADARADVQVATH